MGDVMLKYQIMPESAEQDMEELQAAIKDAMKDVDLRDMGLKPIAFGLQSVEIVMVIPDSGGGTDKIEEKLESLAGVASVNPLGMDLL